MIEVFLSGLVLGGVGGGVLGYWLSTHIHAVANKAAQAAKDAADAAIQAVQNAANKVAPPSA